MKMNENDYKIIGIVKSYLQDNLTDKVRNIVYNYFDDDELDKRIEQIEKRQYKENNSKIIKWFFDDHETLLAFIIGISVVILCIILIVIGIFITYKLDIAKLNEESRICVETGYGCKSSTINKDITYDNAPIVEINK